MSQGATLESAKSVRADIFYHSIKVRNCPEYDGEKKFVLQITIKMCLKLAE